METWEYGDMEACGHGGMGTWEHGGMRGHGGMGVWRYGGMGYGCARPNVLLYWVVLMFAVQLEAPLSGARLCPKPAALFMCVTFGHTSHVNSCLTWRTALMLVLLKACVKL